MVQRKYLKIEMINLNQHAQIPDSFDILLVGGGLVNCLLAWQLKRVKPWVRFHLLEQGNSLGGRHTWSFHEADISAEALRWLAPVISASWPYYRVQFPQYERKIDSRYFSIRSKKLHDVLSRTLSPDQFGLNEEVVELELHAVRLKSGRQLKASLIIDGRGPEPVEEKTSGFQKFLGLELQFAEPHGLKGPLLMDATVEQKDGYRFIYCLPWSENRMLVEDTRYSTNPEIQQEDYRQEILSYCSKNGWQVNEVFDEEVGCLPLPLQDTFFKHFISPVQKIKRHSGIEVGMKAGLFHSTTGYSVPVAVQTVEKLISIHAHDEWPAAVEQLVLDNERRQKLFRILNRILFNAIPEEERYQFLQHFYRLPEDLIEKFYAGEMKKRDLFRFFLRTPPVSFGAAMKTWKRETINGI
ncbi:MAG: lycopene cyclase [Proteobacteria bacterium]|nr:lycopene cyclase [Pseudomonadota bacterium]NDC24892.1 lycopene cyclase [Pseudomonadota bacterium]NDD04696.1 lycopene cyclase [Pseudomonadota bacterium]NDG27628.1 lycopene cyclase [Pseudomonadota bacterium]